MIFAMPFPLTEPALAATHPRRPASTAPPNCAQANCISVSTHVASKARPVSISRSAATGGSYGADTREFRQRTAPRLRVQSLRIPHLAAGQRRAHIHFTECRPHDRSRFVAHCRKRRNDRDDCKRAGFAQQCRDFGDAHVLETILYRKTEIPIQPRPQPVAIEHHRMHTSVAQSRGHRVGQRRLARARQPREPHAAGPSRRDAPSCARLSIRTKRRPETRNDRSSSRLLPVFAGSSSSRGRVCQKPPCIVTIDGVSAH